MVLLNLVLIQCGKIRKRNYTRNEKKETGCRIGRTRCGIFSFASLIEDLDHASQLCRGLRSHSDGLARRLIDHIAASRMSDTQIRYVRQTDLFRPSMIHYTVTPLFSFLWPRTYPRKLLRFLLRSSCFVMVTLSQFPRVFSRAVFFTYYGDVSPIQHGMPRRNRHMLAHRRRKSTFGRVAILILDLHRVLKQHRPGLFPRTIPITQENAGRAVPASTPV